jgi:two-component system, NarL family, nitrate/nitrite response regulator NarL
MPPDDLTPRELEVVRKIVAGCTNREIARDLALSEQTIKNVLSTVYQKCRVRSRLELAIFSLHHDLISKGGKTHT